MTKYPEKNTEEILQTVKNNADQIPKLTDKYDAKITEKFWQNFWQEKNIYQFRDDLSKAQTFVIDTPPPTVSGVLHMGHIFSYTQTDFVARYKRMQGRDVFYPMGFDDNGLPTERLVEKIIGKKAGFYENENGRGSFVAKCREVVDEAEKEFEILFNEIALSVDWKQKYQTISPESQKISQASFIDLFNKDLVEQKNQPVYWDISDRTALAQADIIDKDLEGEMHFLNFAIDGKSELLEIMTTRPELLPACVAVMINGEDVRYQDLILDKDKFKKEGCEGPTGSYAITPLFGVKVPIIADNLVQTDKGTGAVMCCTFGDDTDVIWWEKYGLGNREIIGDDGSLIELIDISKDQKSKQYIGKDSAIYNPLNWLFFINIESFQNPIKDPGNFIENYNKIANKKIKVAKEEIIKLLTDLESTIDKKNYPIFSRPKEKITRPVKCAERSGVPIEIISKLQWYVKINDKKEKLKQKAHQCNWYPQYMRVRIDQWIEGLSRDWCISRQRFFGVKFPVWYSQREGEEGKILVASLNQLPCDPFVDLPEGYARDEVEAEADIMDTWATSSISPQLSSKGISSEICFDSNRHKKLFPADLRPQAHEIIRSWAFYTIVKSYLHSLGIVKDEHGQAIKNQDGSKKLKENSNLEITIPWKNLMISGWCLASDKTKMSKSKGNVVTPTALIQEKSADVVRYWASASSLGADITFSEETFKIGHKLITKLFNSAKFCSQHFAILNQNINQISDEKLAEFITEDLDLWILNRLDLVIKKYNEQFEIFEYAKAREVVEEFFWHYFCDNYLEICKVRSYGLSAQILENIELNADQKNDIIAKQLSALTTLFLCLKNILKLFAPIIPHICEEIYSKIFSEEFANFKSIHARGNYPQLPKNLKYDQKYFQIGDEVLAIIFEVRKFKSEKNLSMKSIIAVLQIATKLDLTRAGADIANVCNAKKIEFILGNNLEVKISC
jgi:valyl-tRNA synthetase